MSPLELIGLIASVVAIVEFIFKAPALIKKIYDGTFCRFLKRFFERGRRRRIPRSDEFQDYTAMMKFLQGSYSKGTRIAPLRDYDIDISLFKKIKF
jgi:hypothetical protein